MSETAVSSTPPDQRCVAVYCASGRGNSPSFEVHARALGTCIAAFGVGLVYGGAHVGLMGEVANAALAKGGNVYGYLPEAMQAAGIAHDALTEMHIVADMHERKTKMVERAHGAIVLPGGYGTLEEAFELLTWNQLGYVSKPVVFLDTDGFFEPLKQFLDHAAEVGLLRAAHRPLAQFTSDPAEAVSLALGTPPDVSSKWGPMS